MFPHSIPIQRANNDSSLPSSVIPSPCHGFPFQPLVLFPHSFPPFHMLIFLSSFFCHSLTLSRLSFSTSSSVSSLLYPFHVLIIIFPSLIPSVIFSPCHGFPFSTSSYVPSLLSPFHMLIFLPSLLSLCHSPPCQGFPISSTISHPFTSFPFSHANISSLPPSLSLSICRNVRLPFLSSSYIPMCSAPLLPHSFFPFHMLILLPFLPPSLCHSLTISRLLFHFQALIFFLSVVNRHSLTPFSLLLANFPSLPPLPLSFPHHGTASNFQARTLFLSVISPILSVLVLSLPPTFTC